MSDVTRHKELLARIAARYEMRPARAGDVAEVAQLHKEMLNDPADLARLERRYAYRYRDNPNSTAWDGLWVCRSRGDLVGMSAMIDTTVWDGEKAVPAAYCADLAVRPAHRGFGVPHALQLAMNDRRDLVFEGNFNADARAMAEATGARTVEGSRVLRRWLRPGDFLRRQKRDGVIEQIREKDERFDGLWERARGAGPLIALRDAATIAWRFFENPFFEFRILALLDNGGFSGYAVTCLQKFRGPTRRALLVDWLFALETPERDRHMLLRAALAHAARSGAVCADALTTQGAEAALLESMGFRAKTVAMEHLVYETPCADERRAWAPEACRLTFADQDLYL